MSAVHPSRHELQRQLDFPWLTDTLVTLQVTGSSVKSWVKVEMAGSSTKGTRNKNANTLTIHRVPVMKNVFYVLGYKRSVAYTAVFSIQSCKPGCVWKINKFYRKIMWKVQCTK